MCLGTLLLVVACGPRHREARSSLDLADFVAHQALNLSTQLISPPEGVGLDNVGPGWRLRNGEGGAPIAEMRRKVARLRVFAPDGDLAAIEAELGLPPDTPSSAVTVKIQLNLMPLAEVDVEEQWSAYRVELPSAMIRSGLNVVDLRHEERSRTNPSPRLRRVRLLSSTGRPLWPRRPDRIRVVGENTSGGVERVVEMPNASYLDMVLRVPEGAYIDGAFGVELAPGEDFAFVEVSIRLLDGEGEEHTLLQERVEGEVVRGRPVDVDLARWTGQLVRLRWGVTGPSNALLRWHRAGVRSVGPGLEPPSLPIERLVPPQSGRLGRPDVIVILLDAARADAFSPFGGPHETPAIERLAAAGTVFRQAVAASSWTLPSVSSLLTGLHADALRVGGWRDPLPHEVPTLPELMRSAGYKTTLFSQHPFYDHDASYRRGFKKFRGQQEGPAQLPLPLELMARNPSRPTFALVHLLPPHIPYTPPAPFRGRHTSDYRGQMTVDPAHLRGVDPSRPERPSESDVRYAFDRYLENVAFADSLVGQVLEILDRHGRFDDALVVLTSDHGEAFMEHGLFLHSQNVYRELLHVPLVVKWPRSVTGFRSVVDEPVSLLDLAPTLVDGLSLSGADDGFQGRSLLPLTFDGRRSERAMYAVRGVNSPSHAAIPKLMLESGGWRVHFAPHDDRIELYRVAQDPLEKEDLASELPLQALLVRQSLLIQSVWNRELLRSAGADPAGGELDPEATAQLEALGYLP